MQPRSLSIVYHGKVPAKSNRYRIIRNREGKARMKVEDAVVAFESALIKLFREQIPYQVTWAVPKGRKREKASDPFFRRGSLVSIQVVLLSPLGKGCDPDNALKAILDSGTKAGLWPDDNNETIREIHIRHYPSDVYELRVVASEICSPPPAAILTFPSPLGRKEWREQRIAEQSLGTKPPIAATFCDLCEVAIGPNCQQEEAWVLPIPKKEHLEYQVICGACADALKLDWKYRLIKPTEMNTLRRFQIGPIIKTRVKELLADVARRIASGGSDRQGQPGSNARPRAAKPSLQRARRAGGGSKS